MVPKNGSLLEKKLIFWGEKCSKNTENPSIFGILTIKYIVCGSQKIEKLRKQITVSSIKKISFLSFFIVKRINYNRYNNNCLLGGKIKFNVIMKHKI